MLEVELEDYQVAAIEAYGNQRGLSFQQAVDEVFTKALEMWDALPEEEKQRIAQEIKDARK
jgi:hypothetical protein